MSQKLSRNKVSHLANLVVDCIKKDEELDYRGDIGSMRFAIFHLIQDELQLLERIEEKARARVASQKKIEQDSREWEILFHKYATEELEKQGMIWD